MSRGKRNPLTRGMDDGICIPHMYITHIDQTTWQCQENWYQNNQASKPPNKGGRIARFRWPDVSGRTGRIRRNGQEWMHLLYIVLWHIYLGDFKCAFLKRRLINRRVDVCSLCLSGKVSSRNLGLVIYASYADFVNALEMLGTICRWCILANFHVHPSSLTAYQGDRSFYRPFGSFR